MLLSNLNLLPNYSNKLVKIPSHSLDNEELQLQEQFRKSYLKNWLIQLGSRHDCTQQIRQKALKCANAVDDAKGFAPQFISLLDELENPLNWRKFAGKSSDPTFPTSMEKDSGIKHTCTLLKQELL